jgi:hypothetical protein
MTVHASGDGVAWDSLETLDVDKPHGLDYRQLDHLAIAVRKRINKEHVDFADATVGGDHIPFGGQFLKVIDDTADISVMVDNTTAFTSLAYCISYANLWCITANPSGGAPDITIVKLGPQSFCLGADYTWTGEHQWDASVQFTERAEFSAVDLTGRLYVDSSADFSDVGVVGDITVTGGMVVDGTAVFRSNVDVSGNADVSGTLSLGSNFTADVSGVVTLPGGILMQWGDDTVNGNDDITFNIAFPTQCFQVFATNKQTTNNTLNPAVTDVSVDLFEYSYGAVDATVRWIAIGN